MLINLRTANIIYIEETLQEGDTLQLVADLKKTLQNLHDFSGQQILTLDNRQNVPSQRYIKPKSRGNLKLI
jgi:flagella basal body P-ring formation protein FlgA